MDTKIFNERMDQLRKIVLRSEENVSATTADNNAVPSSHCSTLKINIGAREIRSTVLLSVTVILYFICWIPGVILLFSFLRNPHTSSITGPLIVYILNHINSAIDPFLYAYNLKGARGAVRRLIRRATVISSSNSTT